MQAPHDTGNDNKAALLPDPDGNLVEIVARLVTSGSVPRGGYAGQSPREGAAPMIGFIVFGLVVGAVARLIKPGKQNLSVLATLGLGLVGSIIGGVVASLLGTGTIWELDFLGSVVAIGAAVALVGTAEALTSKSSSRV